MLIEVALHKPIPAPHNSNWQTNWTPEIDKRLDDLLHNVVESCSKNPINFQEGFNGVYKDYSLESAPKYHHLYIEIYKAIMNSQIHVMNFTKNPKPLYESEDIKLSLPQSESNFNMKFKRYKPDGSCVDFCAGPIHKVENTALRPSTLTDGMHELQEMIIAHEPFVLMAVIIPQFLVSYLMATSDAQIQERRGIIEPYLTGKDPHLFEKFELFADEIRIQMKRDLKTHDLTKEEWIHHILSELKLTSSQWDPTGAKLQTIIETSEIIIY